VPVTGLVVALTDLVVVGTLVVVLGGLGSPLRAETSAGMGAGAANAEEERRRAMKQADTLSIVGVV